ncbi:MAG: efflux RND transporter periplasmic adaptor subunit [Longimicrobiales bacterium]
METQLEAGKRRSLLRDRRLHIALALILVAAVIVYALRRRGSGEVAEAETAEVEAETATAEIRSFAITIPSLGTVEPRPGAFGRIAAPAASRVVRVFVGEGDHVRAGQALIELDAVVFNAQTAQAAAAFEQAERALARQTRLQAEGIAPRKDVEAAAADLGTARAALIEARRIQSLAILRAPLSGVVTGVDVALSQPVDLNESLIEVVDPLRLEIMFHVSPAEAARIMVGAAVELSTTAAAGGWAGAGTVRGIAAVVDSVTHSVEVRVTPARNGRTLRPGETIAGRITVGDHARAVVIPVEALVPGEDGVHVFVVDAKNIAHETAVTVGERNGALAEITAGLTGNERVVTTGAYGVSDGAHINAPKREATPASDTAATAGAGR